MQSFPITIAVSKRACWVRLSIVEQGTIGHCLPAEGEAIRFTAERSAGNAGERPAQNFVRVAFNPLQGNVLRSMAGVRRVAGRVKLVPMGV